MLRSCWSTATGNELWHKSYGSWRAPPPKLHPGKLQHWRREMTHVTPGKPNSELNPFTTLQNGNMIYIFLAFIAAFFQIALINSTIQRWVITMIIYLAHTNVLFDSKTVTPRATRSKPGQRRLVTLKSFFHSDEPPSATRREGNQRRGEWKRGTTTLPS